MAHPVNDDPTADALDLIKATSTVVLEGEQEALWERDCLRFCARFGLLSPSPLLLCEPAFALECARPFLMDTDPDEIERRAFVWCARALEWSRFAALALDDGELDDARRILLHDLVELLEWMVDATQGPELSPEQQAAFTATLHAAFESVGVDPEVLRGAEEGEQGG